MKIDITEIIDKIWKVIDELEPFQKVIILEHAVSLAKLEEAIASVKENVQNS